MALAGLDDAHDDSALEGRVDGDDDAYRIVGGCELDVGSVKELSGTTKEPEPGRVR